MIGFYAAGAAGGSPVPLTPAETIARKLVSWWNFDGDGLDSIGDNHLTGTATYAAGHISQAATKTSRLVNNAATLPDPTTWAKGLSMGGWFYVINTGGEDFELRAASGSTGEAYRIAFRNGNQVHFVVGGVAPNNYTVSSSVGAVATGNWYFVVAMVDGAGAMSLYIGDTLIATGTALAGGLRRPTRVSFGREIGPVFNALRNDSAFVCDDVLTPEEISYLYNSGAGRGSSAFMRWPAGAWTWFNDPRALVAGSQLVVGTVTGAGQIRAYYSTDDLDTPASLFDFTATYSTVDDHDNPAFLRRDDGKLVVFYTRHNDSNCWMRVSTNNDDASAWGSAVNLQPQITGSSFSYNNPVQLTGEVGQPIYNFFRRGTSPSWTMHVSKSSDGGTTWSAGQALLGSGRPYFKVVRNGTDRIDFLVTDGHPNAVSTNSVYHFYYQGGSYYSSAGASLGSPPFATSSLTKIYDGAGAGGRAWIWDIQIAPDGNPVVVYSRFPSTSDHRYMYAKWDGSAWGGGEICAAGGPLYSGELYYSGGVCLDPDDTSKVYAARESGGVWNLYRYRTYSGGSSWSSKDLRINAVRPYAPAGSGKVLAMIGAYSTYLNFATRIVAIEK